MLMMMRVSLTSALLILGIFCSASWAQPDLSRECLQSLDQCVRPLQMAYAHMTPQQLYQQIMSTHLSSTCQPILAAKECAIGVMTECGVFEMTDPRVVEALRVLSVANDVVNYVCRDHVDVFEEHKGCLLRMSGRDPVIATAVDQQCPPPQHPGPTRPFCIPRSLAACVANVVEEQCGEEIAGHLRTIGAQVLEEAGCEARKHFKMLKKNIQSPMELINEALSTMF